MVDAALRPQPMTIEQFLAGYPDDGLRHELVDGRIVAMNPPMAPHALLVTNLVVALSRRLLPPCRVYTGGGVHSADDEHTYRVPALAVSCTPSRGDWVEEPRLIVEIFPPSTQRADTSVKLAFFRFLPSVETILLARSDRRYVDHWQRESEHWTVRNLIGSASLSVPMLGQSIPLDELYDSLELDAEPPA